LQKELMQRRPKVSVLLVTYNHERYVREAIQSILMQVHDYPWELIVADDCSTDSTLSVIDEFIGKCDVTYKVLDSENNLGITKNYKRGFAACQGDYVAVLEGDDYWTAPDRLNSMVTFLEGNRGCVMAFNRFTVRNADSRRYNVQPWPLRGEEFQLITVSDIITDNFIGNFSTCVYRNDVIHQLDDSLYELKVYDWMFNISVSQYGLIAYIPRVMSVYRQHSNGTWTQMSEVDKLKETLESIEIYNHYLGRVYNDEFEGHKARLLGRMAQLTGEASHPSKSAAFKSLIRRYCPPLIIWIIKQCIPPAILVRFKG